jgi:dolichol-phosphate mannosyltransferase
MQVALGSRVIWRLCATARGERIPLASTRLSSEERISIIVPVLNESRRLQPCLDGLAGQGDEVLETILVDGGSEDGTRELVEAAARVDPRVKLVDARPIPADWNGKAWGLECGLRSADRRSIWLLTIDADVRPKPGLARSLISQARRTGASALSVAAVQELAGLDTALVHPAMLATLVYRFGIPGWLTRRTAEVQANGQCMLIERAALEQIGGFAPGRHSVCEDVTVARVLASAGRAVGFYESDGLVSTRMYEAGFEAWRNWCRSLPLRDGHVERWVLLGLLEVLLIQSLPGLLMALGALPFVRRRVPKLLRLNACLVALRLGILVGTTRAYAWRPWSYWLSPLVDLPVALALVYGAVQREHQWRGRTAIRGALR